MFTGLVVRSCHFDLLSTDLFSVFGFHVCYTYYVYILVFLLYFAQLASWSVQLLTDLPLKQPLQWWEWETADLGGEEGGEGEPKQLSIVTHCRTLKLQ